MADRPNTTSALRTPTDGRCRLVVVEREKASWIGSIENAAQKRARRRRWSPRRHAALHVRVGRRRRRKRRDDHRQRRRHGKVCDARVPRRSRAADGPLSVRARMKLPVQTLPARSATVAAAIYGRVPRRRPIVRARARTRECVRA